MRYELSADDAVNGEQLVSEILTAHGVDVSGAYGFIAPRTIEVASQYDGLDLSATIAAHAPDPTWGVSDETRVALAARTRARELSVKAQAEGLTPAEVDELAAQMQYIL